MAQSTAEYMFTLRTAVSQSGFVVQANVDSKVPYCYTVGLWLNVHHPELVVTGLNPLMGARLLRDMAMQVKDWGDTYKPGTKYAKLLESPNHDTEFTVGVMDVQSALVTPGYFEAAFGFYGRKYFLVRQVVWPDTNNLLPWEDGFLPAFRAAQPLFSVES